MVPTLRPQALGSFVLVTRAERDSLRDRLIQDVKRGAEAVQLLRILDEAEDDRGGK